MWPIERATFPDANKASNIHMIINNQRNLFDNLLGIPSHPKHWNCAACFLAKLYTCLGTGFGKLCGRDSCQWFGCLEGKPSAPHKFQPPVTWKTVGQLGFPGQSTRIPPAAPKFLGSGRLHPKALGHSLQDKTMKTISSLVSPMTSSAEFLSKGLRFDLYRTGLEQPVVVWIEPKNKLTAVFEGMEVSVKTIPAWRALVLKSSQSLWTNTSGKKNGPGIVHWSHRWYRWAQKECCFGQHQTWKATASMCGRWNDHLWCRGSV